MVRKELHTSHAAWWITEDFFLSRTTEIGRSSGYVVVLQYENCIRIFSERVKLRPKLIGEAPRTFLRPHQ
jgi:hypothetical protein